MFKKGDKIVYPHHGAGVITAVQDKDVFSEKKRYYILDLSVGRLTVSVPVNNCTELGLRGVITKRKASDVLKTLKAKVKLKKLDYNERYKLNNEKIGTGDAFEIAEVVRDLNKYEDLSTREKRMLSKAKEILISELLHSFNKPEQEMVKQLDKILDTK